MGFRKEMLARVFDPYVTSKPEGDGPWARHREEDRRRTRRQRSRRTTGPKGARSCASCCRWLPRSSVTAAPEGHCMSAGKILVVDDEADIRVLLKEILSDEGYDVDVAADAGQARASRARAVPDLVLLDIWMPDTDGITLLREWSTVAARRLPRGDDVRSRHRRDRRRGHAPRRLRLSSRNRCRSPSCCAPSSAPWMPASAAALPGRSQRRAAARHLRQEPRRRSSCAPN